ncbi:MAG: hypothetical protein RL417_936 [Pseudomonadota bacterium]|jgi:lysozyme family protein
MHDLRHKIAAVALTVSSAFLNAGCSKEKEGVSPEAQDGRSAGIVPQTGKAWSFDECLAFVLEKEGGLSTNRADRGNKNGGSTMRGVTQETYNIYRKSHGQNPRNVSGISPAEVRGVYKELFWDKVRCDQMPDTELKLLMFDASVNHGTGGAVKLLQRALGGLKPDGALGPKTQAALAAVTDFELLKTRLLEARLALYTQVIANDPSQEQFRKGWMNRVDALRRMIAEPLVGAAPPASIPALDASNLPPSEARTYTVEKGDSLWGIVKRELHDVRRVAEVAALNGLDPENPALEVGQKLVIPTR